MRYIDTDMYLHAVHSGEWTVVQMENDNVSKFYIAKSYCYNIQRICIT